MNISQEEAKREEFRSILYSLANDKALEQSQQRAEMYKRLERLYYATDEEKGFRHFYSDIFSVLTQIQLEDRQGNIDVLGQNLSIIRNGYKPMNPDPADGDRLIDISDSIRKLYDHVSLDIARISYAVVTSRQALGNDTIDSIQKRIKELEGAAETTAGELKSQQKEYITILGIFAAIVLAFVGAFTFSTSALNNIDRASIYRLISVLFIIGLVFYDLLSLLLNFLRTINDTFPKNKETSSRFYFVNIVLIVLITIMLSIGFCYRGIFL